MRPLGWRRHWGWGILSLAGCLSLLAPLLLWGQTPPSAPSPRVLSPPVLSPMIGRPPAAGERGQPPYRVVIDPGHGGEDTGGKGVGNLLEKQVTLQIALRIRDKLQKRPGVMVYLTRLGDETVSLERRTALANSYRGDLLISLHTGVALRQKLRGYATFFLAPPIDMIAGMGEAGFQQGIRWEQAQFPFLPASQRLAEAIQRTLHRTLTGEDRGVRGASLGLLKGAGMPAVLIEVASLTAPLEESQLRDPAYQDLVAQGIVEGILHFKEGGGAAP